MKLLFFDDFKLGVLKGDAVVDVSAVVKDIPHIGPGDLINGLIERFDELSRRGSRHAAAQGPGHAARRRAHPPAAAEADNIDCMAVNYMEDGTRSAPAPINAFHKIAQARSSATATRWCCPTCRRRSSRARPRWPWSSASARPTSRPPTRWSYIFGYTNFIDGSARGLPPPGNVFFQMKSRDTFAPIGPYLVTADEITDPQKLQIRLWNNGMLMQNFNTDDMAHKIPRCIEWVTSIHTLEPGDILATGTNHRGLNPFMDGDKVELETEGLGRLELQRQGRAEAHLGAQDPPPDARRGQRRRPPAPTPTSPRSSPANTRNSRR